MWHDNEGMVPSREFRNGGFVMDRLLAWTIRDAAIVAMAIGCAIVLAGSIAIAKTLPM